MKIFPIYEIKQIDAYTIEQEPILSVNLMERASRTLLGWIKENLAPVPTSVFAGTGNNGGDALALARLLHLEGWDVKVFLLNSKGLSPDTEINLGRLRHLPKITVTDLSQSGDLPEIDPTHLVVDGLFGAGLNRPLSGFAAKVARYLTATGAKILSIDLPSGLLGEDNSRNDHSAIVKATYTISFQFPKLSFLFSENEAYVGEWTVIPIGLHPRKIEETHTNWYYVDKTWAKRLLPIRDKFAHKGKFGHALLLSGSYGKMGAAVLASKACLKAGVGLLTTHVPNYGYNIMQTAVPEAMASIDRSDILISGFPDLEPFDAVGAGPGIGQTANTAHAIAQLIDKIGDKPMVLDADALNIMAANPQLLSKLPANTILTPHPKEFQRLAGPWKNDFDRLHKLSAFAQQYGIVVVLKGAHTTVALPDGRCFFNSTGNPGMASAGSGDVLTGIILGLLSQGICPADAAILGTYLHGSAGDIYAAHESEESLTAIDLTSYLGLAFKSLRK
ncbi:MAG: NAD(P)H-hydrate dehydratase [Breznakibacter sp.]